MQKALVTTTFELPGQDVIKSLGIVRGITVRSRLIVGNFFGALQSLFGGNITSTPACASRHAPKHMN